MVDGNVWVQCMMGNVVHGWCAVWVSGNQIHNNIYIYSCLLQAKVLFISNLTEKWFTIQWVRFNLGYLGTVLWIISKTVWTSKWFTDWKSWTQTGFADCFVNKIIVQTSHLFVNHVSTVWITYEMLLAHLKEHHHGDTTCQTHRGVCPPKTKLNKVNKVLADRAFLSAASACSEMIAPEQTANHDRAAH